MGARKGLVLTLVALALYSLSCAVVPVAVHFEVPPSPLAAADAPEAEDPAMAAVLAHLQRFQARSGLTDAELSELAQVIVTESRRHQLDPALVLAVMYVESRFDTFAVSSKDALGLMQILPATGAWLAPSAGVDWRGPQTLFDPISNVRLGVAYLRHLTDRYDGSVRTALVAYNWGPGRIDGFLRAGRPLPPEYAQMVLAAYQPSS